MIRLTDKQQVLEIPGQDMRVRKQRCEKCKRNTHNPVVDQMKKTVDHMKENFT